jgi:hypothetical protein
MTAQYTHQEMLSIVAEQMYRALQLDSCWCNETVKVVDIRRERIEVKCSRCRAIEAYEQHRAHVTKGRTP